jgi:plastocyanin
MKRVSLICLLLAGCASEKQPEKAAVEKVEYFVPDPATASTVSGIVTFLGTAPAAKRISMDAEAECEKLHPEPVYEQSLVVARDRGLANAFVYIKSGLEGKNFAPSEKAVEINQKGCQFIPRVLALRKGQTLAVKNSDPVSHNIHPLPQNNREWNQQQSPGAADLQRRFGFPEVMIPVKCNVHAWMRSYIGVMEHPYFAVTAADGGFRFEALPPGNYVVAAWHEKLGELTQPLTVAAKSEAKLAFAYPRK